MDSREALKRYGEFFDVIEKLGSLPITQDIKIKDLEIDNALYQRIHNAMSSEKGRDVINYLCRISLTVVMFFLDYFSYPVDECAEEYTITWKLKAFNELLSHNSDSPLVRNIYRFSIRNRLSCANELSQALDVEITDFLAGDKFGSLFNRQMIDAIRSEITKDDQ